MIRLFKGLSLRYSDNALSLSYLHTQGMGLRKTAARV